MARRSIDIVTVFELVGVGVLATTVVGWYFLLGEIGAMLYAVAMVVGLATYYKFVYL